MERAPGVGGALDAEVKLGGLTFGGSVSDLLKFGNISVHLCSDATTATVRLVAKLWGSNAAHTPKKSPPSGI
jgi:hypothetical protein